MMISHAEKERRHRIIIDFIEKNKSCSGLDIFKAIDIPKRSVYNTLNELRRQGKVKHENNLFFINEPVFTSRSFMKRLGIGNKRAFYERQTNTIRGLIEPDIKLGFRIAISKPHVINSLMKFRVGPPINDVPECIQQVDLKNQFKINKNSIIRWHRSGLPYFKIGNRVLYAKNEVRDFLKNYITTSRCRNANRLRLVLN